MKHLIKFFAAGLLGLVWVAGAMNPTPARAADPAKVVRIGYQKSGAFLLVKNEGTLEKKLTPLGYTIEWKEFPSGPPLFEALNASGIDLGHSGDAPLIFAQANGVPFVYLGQTRASPESAGIVVPKNSPLKTVADLKGKKLAFAKGSSSHYLVARALLGAGLTFADITPAYLQPPDARAAFQSGTVDAWAIWDPFYAAAEVDAQGRTLISSAGLSPHREYYFGRKEFVNANPGLVGPLLETLRESGEQAMRDPKGTAAFLAPKLGISLAVLERSEVRKQRYSAEPLTAEGITEQQRVADTFLQLGLITKPVRVEEIVYRPAK